VNRTLPVAVVLTYGRRGRHLDAVLDALDAGSVKPSAILVVDNGGTSDADRKRPRATPVRWLDLPENGGSAGGYRAGLEAVAGGSAWLLDDDNRPAPDCLEQLLRARERTPDRAILVAHRPSRPEFAEIVRRGGSRPIRRDSFMAFHLLGTPAGPHPGLPAAAGLLPLAYFGYGGALVPAEAISPDLLPDERLFVYHDDSDWSQRLIAKGFPAWLVPEAHVEDLELSWGGQETSGTSPLFSSRIPALRAWYAVRNRAWVERSMGFGGPWWWSNAFAWLSLQGLRAVFTERRPVATIRRTRLAARAFLAGARGDLALPPGQDRK